ncbi:hypothetical protein [Metabacillus sp. RGM 3146]|uniref:hypothetical protein n=1 Tax=Metabacillus sp. RGM 3146 TaxID=3401092 RepID=UPI003B9C38CB
MYNGRWETSETKKIYQATRNSEMLIEYLEECMLKESLSSFIGEQPNPKRDYGSKSIMFHLNQEKRFYRCAKKRP